jgi:hypothetical protein
MMGERQEDLTTADLAGQPPSGPTDTNQSDLIEEVDLERRDDLTPEDLGPGDPARKELAPRDFAPRDPALNPSSERASEKPDRDPLEQEHEDSKVVAAGAGPAVTPVGVRETHPRPEIATADSTATGGPLLASDDAEAFRARWTDVQFGFVNSPRQAVEQGDGLVAELMQHLARTFAEERSRLESQWDQGSDVSTEDLRTAFQRYRSFFERLLAT